MLTQMRKKIIYAALPVLIVLTSLFISNCDITNPAKGLAVIFNTLSLATTASVTFVYAATGQQIGSSSPQTVNIMFTGPDKAKIVTLRAEPLTTTSTDFGVITFALNDNVIPSVQNPVKITINASASGYISTSYPVVINTAGSRTITVKMVKVSAPPTGTTTSQPTNVSTTGNGQVTNTVNVQTQTTEQTKGIASLSIPSNTVLSDEDGNPVTGSLIATVTYSSGRDISNSASLPTGLSVTTVDQSGSRGRGYLQPAAVASFTIANQSGQSVRRLSQPVQLSMSIPEGTINPSTSSAIKNGDAVPIYSFDETAQAWKFETNATASGPDANGNFTLNFQATHLSNWMAGWIASGAQTCTKDFTLNINGSFSAITLKVLINGETTVFSTDLTSNQTSFSVNNLTVPKGVPVKIIAYGRLICPNPVVGELDIPDLCAAPGNLTLNVNSGSDRKDVYVDVTAICPHRDPVLKIKPDGYDIFVTNSCGNDINVGTLHNGKITLKGFLINTSYTFKIIYKGKVYSDTHLVDQTSYIFDYTLDDNVCADFQ